MNEQNHETRIKQLENSVDVLKDAVRGLVDMHSEIIEKVLPPLSQNGLLTTDLACLLHDEIDSIRRFIASQEVFGDKESRQKMLDEVARSESKFDALRKQIQDAMALLNKGKQNPPPPPA